LRCNGTNWNVGESNRFKPTADPNVFALDYTISLPYLATQPDSCLFTETNQLNGWGTSQTNYQAIGGTLNVPGQRSLQVGWQNILVRYPALGAYRATYNVAQKRLAVATQPIVAWRWPLAGQNGRDWVINNYVDGPGSGADDYTGGTRTYPGHAGVDIDISTFRNMDAGVSVMSVGAGQVTSLEETQPDRNMSCMGDWNHVTVRTPDGSTIMYGHLRRNSVIVNVGDTVQAGTVLAQVGSSGCSTQPHLHLEAYNPQGALIDPFKQGLWQSPPSYNVPLQIMDLIVNDFFYGPEDSLLDPPPNATQVRAPHELSVGLSVGGGSVGDAPGIRVLRPDGSQFDRVDFTFDFGPAGHTLWLWGWGLEPVAGTWRVQSLVNGQVERTWPIQVVP
jgi:murein DD-endopeptidase MepM/ murein hydrolase activator NlpD